MPSLCHSIAFIESLGGPEMVMIFVIVLVLFGGKKLPEFARGMGKSIREFKKAAAGVEEEFKRALEEDEQKSAAAARALESPPPTPTPDTPATGENQGLQSHAEGYGHDEYHPNSSGDTAEHGWNYHGSDEVAANPATTTPEATPAASTEIPVTSTEPPTGTPGDPPPETPSATSTAPATPPATGAPEPTAPPAPVNPAVPEPEKNP